MSTKELEQLVPVRIQDITDQAPLGMVQRVLEAIEEPANGEAASMECMARFFKNIEEDNRLLPKLAK